MHRTHEREIEERDPRSVIPEGNNQAKPVPGVASIKKKRSKKRRKDRQNTEEDRRREGRTKARTKGATAD